MATARVLLEMTQDEALSVMYFLGAVPKITALECIADPGPGYGPEAAEHVRKHPIHDVFCVLAALLEGT